MYPSSLTYLTWFTLHFAGHWNDCKEKLKKKGLEQQSIKGCFAKVKQRNPHVNPEPSPDLEEVGDFDLDDSGSLDINETQEK